MFLVNQRAHKKIGMSDTIMKNFRQLFINYRDKKPIVESKKVKFSYYNSTLDRQFIRKSIHFFLRRTNFIFE